LDASLRLLLQTYEKKERNFIGHFSPQKPKKRLGNKPFSKKNLDLE
jgi:hypothetical protein